MPKHKPNIRKILERELKTDWILVKYKDWPASSKILTLLTALKDFADEHNKPETRETRKRNIRRSFSKLLRQLEREYHRIAFRLTVIFPDGTEIMDSTVFNTKRDCLIRLEKIKKINKIRQTPIKGYKITYEWRY